MAVHHGHREEPGIDHLEQVLVLQVLVGRPHPDLRLAGLAERGVQAPQALVVTAGGADADLLPAEIVEALEGRGGRPGDDQLAHVRQEGRGEVHLLPALGRDGEVGGGDVTPAAEEPREELVPAHRDDDDAHLDGLAPELLVDVALERLERVVRDSLLPAAVDEVEGLAVDDQRPDLAALGHPVEVALRRAGDGQGRHGLVGGLGVRRGDRGAEQDDQRQEPRSQGVPSATAHHLSLPGLLFIRERVTWSWNSASRPVSASATSKGVGPGANPGRTILEPRLTIRPSRSRP